MGKLSNRSACMQDDALRLFNGLHVEFWKALRSARALQQSWIARNQPSSSVF